MLFRWVEFLILLALYAIVGIVVSVQVGDVALGFGLATVGCIMMYAAAVELTK